VSTELGLIVLVAGFVRLVPHRFDGLFGEPVNLKAIIDSPSSVLPDKPLLRRNFFLSK